MNTPTATNRSPVLIRPQTLGDVRTRVVSWCRRWALFMAMVMAGVAPVAAAMLAQRDVDTGRWDLFEDDGPVLSYNYQTNEPGERLAQVSADNLKYARARSDYLHPIYGPTGEVLTADWSVDHPHHRGIYWAWPEVEVGVERGDLHALQRVFARPTGRCTGTGGSEFAQIEAENLWRWEDREAVVREVAIIRAWASRANGRRIDLELRFTALREGVTIARRETRLYGGLNVRLERVTEQMIAVHTDPIGATPRRAWADLSGIFAGGQSIAGLAILQHPANPDYPGDWVQYPELNWLQPTFPAADTRYRLELDKPLVLRFGLWVHRGRPEESALSELWDALAAVSEVPAPDMPGTRPPNPVPH